MLQLQKYAETLALHLGQIPILVPLGIVSCGGGSSKQTSSTSSINVTLPFLTLEGSSTSD
jgi:hypothetical protein